MTNTRQIKAALVACGLTQAQAAKRLGMSQVSFNYKINNKREFKAKEIEKLCEILHITDVPYYFFVDDVDYLSTIKSGGDIYDKHMHDSTP